MKMRMYRIEDGKRKDQGISGKASGTLTQARNMFKTAVPSYLKAYPGVVLEHVRVARALREVSRPWGKTEISRAIPWREETIYVLERVNAKNS